MEYSQRRHEFNVMVVGREPLEARSLADRLKSLGYEDIQFFPTFESAEARAREIPPHVIVLDVGASIDTAVENFLVDMRALSEEILTIAMVPAPALLGGLQLVSRSLAYDCVLKPVASSLEILQKVDRAAGRLYFQFESEQLREHYEGSRGEEPAPPPARPVVAGTSERLASLSRKVGAAVDVDDCLRVYVDALAVIRGDSPVLYFKYLATHCSLIFSHAALLPEDRFRGVGLDLRKGESAHGPEEFFTNPAASPALAEMAREIFKRESFSAQAHLIDGEPSGLVMILDDSGASSDADSICLGEVFQAAFRRNLLLKERHGLETSDAVTGFHDGRHFSRVLGEEISRARRLFLPVSLVVFAFDGWARLRESIGEAKAEALLRACAQLLRKTARVNDIFARLDVNSFALILPHTSQMGAAMKAERMRRLIEATKFPVLDGTGVVGLTISCGVSEYPTLSGDSEALLSSADDSLDDVRSASGNKVCLSTPPPRFEPDFVPREVPESPKAGGGGSE